MYGQIHCVIRELVLKRFGKEAWDTILAKSELDEHQSFLMFTRYDDASTFKLVGATLEVSVEMVLEIFGEFFFEYCLCHGYDKMLRTLGSDIKSFIQNLDSLHSLLALSYKGISAPSFRCEDGSDGDLILHYYSSRPGLYPIVKGMLRAVARDLFQQCLEMTVIEQQKEDFGFNQSQQHTAFRCQLTCAKEGPVTEDAISEVSDCRSLVEFKPDTVLLKVSDFCSAFPYHIIFNRNLRIRQCGVLIQKHSHVTLHDGTPLDEAFEIVHPRMVLSIENIRKFINAVFLLAISPQENGQKTLVLKGQMIWIPDTEMMIFIGSPRLTSLNELMEMNVYLADIPLYDVTRELVLLNQQRIAEIDIAKKLDETTAELKKTWQALKEEKLKTETLLDQMLPRKVAKALTNNEKVEAEKFDQVTVLFSDIVTFTNIASACSPMDIVNMLNEMYQRFDARTSLHNVYKVETIGDAYMIVSGVPEVTNDHAQPVANFAMDMIEDAGLVLSPATGKPLQIRVGVHTGPVVAGVVGVKMPRYCLFGDTVNTASRMESHGAPGRIHLSSTAYQALRGWGYAFKHRDEMDIKGKGKMHTYFLCGHLERRLADPPDDFCDLEIHADGTEQGLHVEWPPLKQDSSESLAGIDSDQRPNSFQATTPEPALVSKDNETTAHQMPRSYATQTNPAVSLSTSDVNQTPDSSESMTLEGPSTPNYTETEVQQTLISKPEAEATLSQDSKKDHEEVVDSLISGGDNATEMDKRQNGVPLISVSHFGSCCASYSSSLSLSKSGSVSSVDTVTSDDRQKLPPQQTSPIRAGVDIPANASTGRNCISVDAGHQNQTQPSSDNEGNGYNGNGVCIHDNENHRQYRSDINLNNGSHDANDAKTGSIMVRSQTSPHPFSDEYVSHTLPLSTSQRELHVKGEKTKKKKRKRENSKLCLLS